MAIHTKFISFEGIDFSGKTTQIDLLKKQLVDSGEEVYVLREPGGTRISEKIRDMLLDRELGEMTDVCETLLYSAARNQLVVEKIRGLLMAGNFIIADRYVDSTTAYQGYGRKIPAGFIRQLNEIATAGLMPDLTFFLDLDTATVRSRKKKREDPADRLESEDADFYMRVRKGYHKIAELELSRVKIIDAAQSVTDINKQIWEFVKQKFEL